MAKRSQPTVTQEVRTEDGNINDTIGGTNSKAEKLAEELSQEGLFDEKPSEMVETTEDDDKIASLLDGGDVFNIDISKRRATVKNLLDAIKADALNSDSVFRCFPELDPKSVERLLPSIVNAKTEDIDAAEAKVEVILSLSDGEDNQ